MNQQGSKNTVLWIVGGCGLLVVLGLCALGGVGYLAYKKAEEDSGASQWDPQPIPDDPYGMGAGGPTPPPGGQALPPGLPPGPLPFAPHPVHAGPWHVRTTVIEAIGVPDLLPGSVCEFDVELHPQQNDRGYWCRTDVRCGSKTLFGGDARWGFFGCALYDAPASVVGLDGETSAQGGDPAFSIDSRAGLVWARDDASGAAGAFHVRAVIESITVR
ncbi:MAG: hypothetical protein OEY14_01290 [Myxococcales bacterium]|nr:hypothetical protein [Myxococcales bacterium]